MIFSRLNLIKSALLAVIMVVIYVGPTAKAAEMPAVDESNAYQLQLMTQIFDGQRDFSHSQKAALVRARKGGESYTLMDFGDSSVFIETADQTNASNFENISGIEAEFTYNYDTKTLSGQNQMADYFNKHIRSYLVNNPDLGRDAKWEKTVALRDLNVSGVRGTQVTIALMRDYFTHAGKNYVLLHYQFPAFSYTSASGQDVIQWGEGVAISDPGFGEIYWNASLQRAVATENSGINRPYRYAKTLAATDRAGIPLIDPRKMDVARPYFERFYGATKTGVIGFVDSPAKPDQSPIAMAANLDVMALSIAEGSANESPQISNQYISGNSGNYKPLKPLGARAMTGAQGGSQIVFGADDTDPSLAVYEQTHAVHEQTEEEIAKLDEENATQVQLVTRGGKPPINLQGFGSAPRNFTSSGNGAAASNFGVAQSQTQSTGNTRRPVTMPLQGGAQNTVNLATLRAEQKQRDMERARRVRDGKKNPVTFDPVVWDPPEWEPPEWEPPEWLPPEFEDVLGSIIDFTQFDGSVDDNWLGFASIVAFDYADMSGKIATDLEPYEEFIAKYGLRKLERLALQAGYPNLASALNDWENLVAKANDQGFRRWARQQPVCYMACTNMLGLWTQKLSQLALGDILLDSRALFSTAGLTDVSIGSLLLTIFFRDFALEDGDAIRIIVSQFGREVFNSSFVLTNAGESINILLRPGVASVQITALNTGEIPPNTAAVSIENVTDGDSEQTYSLDEGETAVLRVNTARR